MTQNFKIIRRFAGERVFFTSDTHFCHANIIQFCNRPFQDIVQMNRTLIDNWNRMIGKDDVVFHLGDFAFGGIMTWNRILDRLNGRITLIVGNHDIKNMRPAIMERFEDVAFEMYVEIDEQRIVLNHNPFLCYGGSYDNVWQLFGHVHTRRNYNGRDKERLPMLFPTQYDVGVDNNNYSPISFTQVKDIICCQISQSHSKI